MTISQTLELHERKHLRGRAESVWSFPNTEVQNRTDVKSLHSTSSLIASISACRWVKSTCIWWVFFSGMLAHTRAHTHSWMHACTLTQTHTHTHTHTHTCTHTYTHIHPHTEAHTHTHTHTLTHTHTHTHTHHFGLCYVQDIKKSMLQRSVNG